MNRMLVCMIESHESRFRCTYANMLNRLIICVIVGHYVMQQIEFKFEHANANLHQIEMLALTETTLQKIMLF